MSAAYASAIGLKGILFSCFQFSFSVILTPLRARPADASARDLQPRPHSLHLRLGALSASLTLPVIMRARL